MKLTILAIAFALITSVAFVSGVIAQQQSTPPASREQSPPASTTTPAKMEKFSGAIGRLDAARKEIVVKKGNDEKTFSWDDHTNFMEGSKERSFNDLKKGMNVTVQYKEEGGKFAAEKVTVSKPKTSAKKSHTEKSY